MTISLVAIEGDALLRRGLARAVAGSPDITLAGEAGTGDEALAIVREVRPDVVTIGMKLPDADGIALALQLRRILPDLGVVVLTSIRADAVLFRALDRGMSAYVHKSTDVPGILAAIRHAAVAPHSFTTPDLSGVLRRLRQQGGLLSNRERQVLQLMRDGSTLPSIAAQLRVSEATVKTYAGRIYGKLHVNNRAQALMAAMNQGLLHDDGDPA